MDFWQILWINSIFSVGLFFCVALLRWIVARLGNRNVWLLWVPLFVRLMLPVSKTFRSCKHIIFSSNEVIECVSVWVWVNGVILFCVILGLQYLSLWLTLRERVFLKENVWLCDGISSSFTQGILNPRIYFPSDMQEEHIPFILAHEKEHIRRKDSLWLMIAFIVVLVYWFNPLVWCAFLGLRSDLECACDAAVTNGKDQAYQEEYARVLLLYSLK